MKPPRGFVAVWSTIGAGALAVIVYQAVHHSGAPSAPRVSARPAVTVTVTAAPVPGLLPPRAHAVPARSPDAPGRAQPAAAAGAGVGRSAASVPSASVPSASLIAASGRPTAPRTPSPPPSPPGAPLSAAAAVTVRGPVLVAKGSPAIPGAPPFPPLAVGLNLRLP